jgi:hypothetical protein
MYCTYFNMCKMRCNDPPSVSWAKSILRLLGQINRACQKILYCYFFLINFEFCDYFGTIKTFRSSRVSSEWNFSFQFLVFRMVLFSFEICSCVSSDVLLKFQFSIFSFIFVFCPLIGGYYNDNFNTPPTLSRPIRLLSDYPRQIHSFDWDSMPAKSFLETTRQKQATVMKHLDHLYQLPLQHSM